MLSFFEAVLVFAGIGQLLDLILVGPKEREKIGSFIDRAQPSGSLLNRYLKMLALSRDVVFGRYFSDSFASKKFIRSTAVLSVSSFVLVVFLQSAFHGKLPISLGSPAQIATIIAFIVFNILVDYFSVSQTKAFIDAASTAKSWFRSLLFLVSDVLVTMNIFILAFSAFLMFFAFAYLAPNANSEKSLVLTYKSATVDDAEIDRDTPRLDEYQNAFLFEKSEGTFRADFLSYEGTINLSPKVIEQVVKAILGLSLTEITIIPTDAASTLRDLEISVSEDALRKELLERALEQGEPEAFRISAVSSFLPGSFAELNYAYTSVFSFVDLLEDGFPQNIMNDIGWTPLSDVIEGIYRNQILSGAAFEVLCFDGETVGRVYFYSDRPDSYQEDCAKRLVLSPTDRLGLVNDFALSGRGAEDLYIPYLPMFVTSILPTVFFYFSILALSVSTFLFQFVVSKLKVRKELLLRVPITLPMALLGVFYAL